MAAKRRPRRRSKAPEKQKPVARPALADTETQVPPSPADTGPDECQPERPGPVGAGIGASASSHGTLGQKAVKAAGGMAIVEDSDTAEYPNMPGCAIATDEVTRRLAAIVENSADAIISKGLDGTIQTWNAGAERLYGYTAQEMVGRPIWSTIPNERAEEWANVMSRLGRGEQVEEMETERIHKDGRRIPVAVTYSPIRNADGKVASISAIVRDITERKRVVQALRESEKRLEVDLAIMNLLQQVSTRLVQTSDSSSLLFEILDTAIAGTAADMGNIQLLDTHSGTLKIVASRGFEKPFLEYFNAVQDGQAACGTALRRGRRVVIEDVTTSPVFVGSPELDVLLAAGVRAVQTTPLVSRSGHLVGMLSTQYRSPRQFADQDLKVIDLLTRQAADWVERTHDDAALRERELRLRRMMENAHVGIAFGDSEGRIVQANKTMLELVGWSEEDLHAGQVNCGALSRPEDRAKDLWAMTQLATVGRVGPDEKILIRADGAQIPVLISAFRLDANRGENVTFVVDLTAQKRADRALRESEERFRHLAEGIRLIPWEADASTWEFTYVGPQATDILGYPPDQWYGNSRFWVEHIHPDDREWAVNFCMRHSTGDEPHFTFEYRMIACDGHVVWLHDIVNVVRDESGVRQLRGFLIDISERKQVEEALRDHEGRLRAILDTAADAIITIDHRGIIQSVNSATEGMFGYAAPEMIGQNVSMLMSSPHRETHDGYLAKYLQRGEKHVIGVSREVDARRKDGSIFPTELAVSEIKQLNLFTGIHRDLTDRKQLERDVVEAASLEQRRIGQDLHDTVAQELTALSLLTKDLAETSRTDPSGGAILLERVAQGLQRSQQQLRAVLRGLLPVAVDAEGLMAALADLAERTRQEGSMACIFDCPKPVRVADNVTATHLFLIAQEAVHNALKHAQAQNIRISLESNHSLDLCVHDDGIGIPDAPTETQGLGMRIMRNRAAIIGATLTVEAAKPTGTLVSCLLTRRNTHERDQAEQTRPSADRR